MPAGQAADVGDGWSLTVLGANRDGNADVMAESPFNDEPPVGHNRVLVYVSLTYNGGAPSSYPFVSTSLVGSRNIEHRTFDSICIPPVSLDPSREIFQGGSIEGNECFTVPTDEVDSLLLYARAGFGTDAVFFALP